MKFDANTFKAFATMWETLDPIVARMRDADDPKQLLAIKQIRNMAFEGMRVMVEDMIQNDANFPFSTESVRKKFLAIMKYGEDPSKPLPESMSKFDVMDLVEDAKQLLEDQLFIENKMGHTRAQDVEEALGRFEKPEFGELLMEEAVKKAEQ